MLTLIFPTLSDIDNRFSHKKLYYYLQHEAVLNVPFNLPIYSNLKVNLLRFRIQTEGHDKR